MLVLSLYPCADVAAQCVSHPSSVSTSVVAEHEHTSEQHAHCTPFCSCACCGMVISSLDIKLYEIDLPLPTQCAPQPLVRHVLQVATPYCGKIWTPPKIRF